MWDKLGGPNWCWQLLCETLTSFNYKGFCYSFAWSCNLCAGGTSFWSESSLNSEDFCLCFWQAFLLLVSYFLYHCQSLSSSFCTVFDAISSNCNKDDAFSIHSSGNLFIFGGFNIHHKDLINVFVELIVLLKYVVIFNQSQVTLFRWSYSHLRLWFAQSCVTPGQPLFIIGF